MISPGLLIIRAKGFKLQSLPCICSELTIVAKHFSPIVCKYGGYCTFICSSTPSWMPNWLKCAELVDFLEDFPAPFTPHYATSRFSVFNPWGISIKHTQVRWKGDSTDSILNSFSFRLFVSGILFLTAANNVCIQQDAKINQIFANHILFTNDTTETFHIFITKCFSNCLWKGTRAIDWPSQASEMLADSRNSWWLFERNFTLLHISYLSFSVLAQHLSFQWPQSTITDTDSHPSPFAAPSFYSCLCSIDVF